MSQISLTQRRRSGGARGNDLPSSGNNCAMSAFEEAEASYTRVLAARPGAELEAQARRNLASLYHAWGRAFPKEAKGRLEKAIKLYEGLQPECALELAGAYAEAGDAAKAQAIYDRVCAGGVTADPKRLIAQTNYALMKKDAALAGAVCSCWATVQTESAELREARLKALSVKAYLLLCKEDVGALAAYTDMKKYAAETGLPLDAEAEHNAGVAAHMQALKAAARPKGGGAV